MSDCTGEVHARQDSLVCRNRNGHSYYKGIATAQMCFEVMKGLPHLLPVTIVHVGNQIFPEVLKEEEQLISNNIGSQDQNGRLPAICCSLIGFCCWIPAA